MKKSIILLLFIFFFSQVHSQEKMEPPWMWSIDKIKSTANQISAGKNLNPEKWPNGARAAVSLSFDVDIETPRLHQGIGNISQGEYGARVGLKRIIDLVDMHRIPVTFFIPAVSLILHPEMVDIIKKSGLHEIGNHSWIHEQGLSVPDKDEKELIIRANKYLEKITGERPVGYRSASWNLRKSTINVIQELDFLYDSSLMADDRPYEILVDGKSTGIVEIPPDWILDDYPLLYVSGTRYSSPREVLNVYIDEFDKAYEEGTTFILSMHPEIIGHRSRIVILEKLIDHIKTKGNVWFATCRQIAEYVKNKD